MKFDEISKAIIRLMGNQELLDEILRAARGDDYDGCFTKYGQDKYDFLQEELYERLEDWLKY